MEWSLAVERSPMFGGPALAIPACPRFNMQRDRSPCFAALPRVRPLARTRGSEKPATVRDRQAGADQDDFALFVREAQHQHLTDELPDLLGGEVHDPGHLPPHETSWLIVLGNLR